MWYVVQTPVGREAEAAEKLFEYAGQMDWNYL